MKKQIIDLIKNENALLHIKEFFNNKRSNGVICLYTAASIYGLCEYNLKEIDITFPKGSVPKGIYDSRITKYNVFQRNKEFYDEEISKVFFNGKEFRIYSIEKVVAEIAKEFVNDHLNEKAFLIIKNFYSSNRVDFDKLHSLYKQFKILEQMKILERALEVNVKSEVVSDIYLKAKQLFKENIYYLMRFESKLITFPMVSTIIDGGSIPKKYDYEWQVTSDLIKAWKWNIENDKKVNIDYIKQLNLLLVINQALEPGEFRTSQAYISGTNYLPSILSEEQIKDKIEYILSMEDKIEASLEWVCWGIKSQMFWDGNKRTSILVANKILMDNNIGLLTIDESNLFEFNNLLSDYYNAEENKKQLKDFLREKCLIKI